MSSLKEFVNKKLSLLKSQNNYRSIKTLQYLPNQEVMYNGKKLLSFSSNDYLGLRFNNVIIDKTINIAKGYGLGAGASRLVTGNFDLYNILEEKIANFKDYEAACVFGSGYLANIGVLSAIVSKVDLIIADKFVHASIIDGIKLSGAKFFRYRHNDLTELEEILENNRGFYKNCLIITESIFSMDGDKADINQLKLIASKYQAWLCIDDAHGVGKSLPKVDILMGTFSKAFASYGAYVCASNEVIDYIKNTSRSLIFTTGLPPYVVATSLASLEYIKENPGICDLPEQKANLFCKYLGFNNPESQIVPIIIKKSEDTVLMAKELEKEGFLISAIRPPTVPNNTARLRLSFSANHKDSDVIQLAKYIKSKL